MTKFDAELTAKNRCDIDMMISIAVVVSHGA